MPYVKMRYPCLIYIPVIVTADRPSGGRNRQIHFWLWLLEMRKTSCVDLCTRSLSLDNTGHVNIACIYIYFFL